MARRHLAKQDPVPFARLLQQLPPRDGAVVFSLELDEFDVAADQAVEIGDQSVLHGQASNDAEEALGRRGDLVDERRVTELGNDLALVHDKPIHTTRFRHRADHVSIRSRSEQPRQQHRLGGDEITPTRRLRFMFASEPDQVGDSLLAHRHAVPRIPVEVIDPTSPHRARETTTEQETPRSPDSTTCNRAQSVLDRRPGDAILWRRIRVDSRTPSEMTSQ